jgi:hypothetical protein
MNDSQTVADPPWLTAMVEHEGYPLALRLRPTADTAKNRARYPRLAVITHALAQVRPNGLPVPDYNDLLAEFDVAVVQAVAQGDAGLIVLVETFGGRRNYYAYVAAPDHAESAVDSLRKRFPEHQLSLAGRMDSEWRFLNQYRKLFPSISQIRETGGGWTAQCMTLSRQIVRYLLAVFGWKFDRDTAPLTNIAHEVLLDFPDDENGDALRRMAARGADLNSPRIIDFEHRFPDAESAQAFHTAVSDTVLEAVVHVPDPDVGSDWQVQCRARMIPTHPAITETELRLAALARKFGGFPDGWGSLSNPDGSPAQ